MDKFTHTAEDGTTTDYFPQSYTDAAVVAALANATTTTPSEIDLKVGESVVIKAN